MIESDKLRWWQTRTYAALLVCLAAVPLLTVQLPPLTDLLGHLGRYRVQLDHDTSPFLGRYYGFQWALLGNLGVDLLVEVFAPLFGLEPTVRAIIIAIPMLAAAGLLWSAREAHGRLPATAAAALPAIYGYPFQFGFANYCLSMALAFCAFGLWLRLGRQGRIGLRAALFVPIGPILWVCHTYGWCALSVMVFAAEWIRWRATGRNWLHTGWHAGLSSLPLAPPILLMLAWRSGAVAGQTTDWFNFRAKYLWMLAALRDRWMVWDLASVAAMWLLIVFGIARIGFRIERRLGFAALALAIAYVLIPRILLGSAYADMRLAPYVLGIGVLALAPVGKLARRAPWVAVAALAFFGARMAGTTFNYRALDRGYARQLEALDHVPRGSRILVLINLPCSGVWHYSRMDHLGSVAIARREAFVNGQWAMAGAQLLSIRHKAAGRFAGDPTQLLRPERCHRNGEPRLADTVANFPRAAFDYFWMIDRPVNEGVSDPDLRRVWQGARSGILYRVVRPAPPPRPS
ncbi:hypothetical protein [Sphingomonas jatrophae]|uniref:Glucosyl transferase GtrII n=1 Tax=Sphingomonas jatrophae TaxID=1166337 RepID=A0A1I6LP84_9SPHN|nr:hypothetical protein [Sphingomonas jatrophae]SFS05251.1 hypothetical protein SAMN05192580_3074 [Sphingomonas jatrophae]